RDADLWPATVKAAPARGRVLDRHENRTAPFAADADALEDAQDEQQDRRPDADRLIGREKADQERCHAHDQNGQHQHSFTADPIAIVTEDDAADRSRQKADEEGRISEQGAYHRIVVRKEQLVQHNRCHHAVKEEVIPFNGCADRTCHGYFADRNVTALAGSAFHWAPPDVLTTGSRWWQVK